MAVVHTLQQRALPDCRWTRVQQRVEHMSHNPVGNSPAVKEKLAELRCYIFSFTHINTICYAPLFELLSVWAVEAYLCSLSIALRRRGCV